MLMNSRGNGPPLGKISMSVVGYENQVHILTISANSKIIVPIVEQSWVQWLNAFRGAIFLFYSLDSRLNLSLENMS